MMLSPTFKIEAALAKATTYSEWAEAAQALDRESGKQAWRDADESQYFDYKSIRRRLETLAELRKAGDNKGLLYTLNEGIHGNMDGMANDRLYHVAKFGSKQLIHDYVDAIVEAIEHIASADVTDISFDEKRDFLRRAHHCYGCSALLMSGSGAFLFFHAGVVKAMWSEGVLPSIISGSSGGSIIGALVCTRTDDELEPYFDPEFLAREDENEEGGTAFNLFGTSKRMGQLQVKARLEEIIPDITFQEAYEITGRHLNVSVAPAEKHQNGRLLNAIASPNVYIREAVLASCAVPGIYDPVQLMAKDHNGKRVPYLPGRKWVDGSVTHDLPVKRLSRLYGVNHHIVSQANPLVTPFASDVTQLPSAFASIRRASVSTIKAWLNVNMQLWEKPLALFPQVQRLANLSMSVINQEYSGDINIVRPMMFWSPSKMLSSLSVEDITGLIESGERATWPEVERVRAQTKISQTLDRILDQYEQAEIATHDEKNAMKRKIA
jgi:TAG lipase / steryl ester hydrolase / phospholipase A2 / LPA acyltransferase